jgi:hypothetical protein
VRHLFIHPGQVVSFVALKQQKEIFMPSAFEQASIGTFISYKITGEKNVDVSDDHIGINFDAYDLPFDHHEQLHVTVTLSPELTHQMLDRLLDKPEFAEQAIKKLIDLGPET